MPDDRLPRLGLGTYQDEEDPAARARAVETALEAGYRHVDTAEVYGNQAAVGRGVRRADVPRQDVFLATKVVHDDRPGPAVDDQVGDALRCLDLLGVDYVDLLYVHWPVGVYAHDVTVPAFNELYDRGVTRGVGLSNFTPELLDAARERLDPPLLAHQVEMHPLLQQTRLHEYAVEHDHWLVAYSPLAKGRVFDVPEVRAVAEKHGVSPAVVSLAWLLDHENVAVIPKATSPEHVRANLAARDVDLDDDDRARIDGIDREVRTVDHAFATWNRDVDA